MSKLSIHIVWRLKLCTQQRHPAKQDGAVFYYAYLIIKFLGEAVGEFKGGDEAGLLVQAAEVTDQIDDRVFFYEGFANHPILFKPPSIVTDKF